MPADIVFALFDLLGLQFSPRLRDLANQRLCRIKGRDLSLVEDHRQLPA